MYYTLLYMQVKILTLLHMQMLRVRYVTGILLTLVHVGVKIQVLHTLVDVDIKIQVLHILRFRYYTLMQVLRFSFNTLLLMYFSCQVSDTTHSVGVKIQVYPFLYMQMLRFRHYTLFVDVDDKIQILCMLVHVKIQV